MNAFSLPNKQRGNRWRPEPHILLLGLLILSACVPATAVLPESASQDNVGDNPLSPYPSHTKPAASIPEPLPTATPKPQESEPSRDLEDLLIEPGIESQVEEAMVDLARRLDISVGLIQVLRAESITWPDTSLGCPQPGVQTIQTPQDGVRIVLYALGASYEYHSGDGETLFLCESLPTTPEVDVHILFPPTKEIYLPPAPEK